MWAEVTRTEALAPMTAAMRDGRVHFEPNGWNADCLFYLSNNHVLASIAFAHSSHPVSKKRRVLVLVNSLSFAFFLVALAAAILPHQLRTNVVVVSALLQLAWDVPGAMLGTCPCASTPALPLLMRRTCGYVSLACLTCHLLLGLVYALLGALMLLFLPWVDLGAVASGFVTSKVCATQPLVHANPRPRSNLTQPTVRQFPLLTSLRPSRRQLLSFVLAVPLNVLVFAVLRHWELSSTPGSQFWAQSFGGIPEGQAVLV